MTGPSAAGSFLSRLSESARAALLDLGVCRRFEAGRRLMSEGDESDHVELILRGFVKITANADGIETLLAIRVPGDVVGETAGLTGRPRMATATACGRVMSAVVSSAAFRHFLAEWPEAAVSIAAAIGDRLRWANVRRTDFAAYPPEVRLGRVLIDLAAACGRPTAAGVLLAVPLNQAELASLVGVAVPTLQRAVRQLRESGLIATGYRQITIPDVDAIHAAFLVD